MPSLLPSRAALVHTPSHHSRSSSLREKMIEHVFIGDLFCYLWRRGITEIELLRPESDLAGYDLVIECNGITRHIQFKASHRAAATDQVSIQAKLATKMCGCVIWIRFDSTSLEIGPYLWLGGSPGEPLPPLGDRVAKHSRANSQGIRKERSGHRLVKKSRFRKLDTINEVADALFFHERPG